MRMSPYDHQEKVYQISKEMPYYGLFWEMGTCKTKPIIDTATHLFMNGELDGLIVISDNGCYRNWPIKEIPKHLPLQVPSRQATWSSGMTRQERADFERLMVAQDDCLDIIYVNVEAFSGEKATAAVSQFVRNHYCMMVVDESTSIKNIKSERFKNIFAIGQMCDYRRIMTGTPITQSPLDLFAQCEFLKPGLLGYRSFVAFKSDFAIVKQVPSGRWHYDMILGYRNLEILYKLIQPFTSRLTKEECLDLPEKVYETIQVEQTPQQEEAYRNLKNLSLVQFQQGLLSSTTAIATILKLHQINCGHVKIDDHTVIDIPSNRAKVLIEQLDKLLPLKVVIWCRFQRDIQLISAAIKEHYEKEKWYSVDYYGETTERDRDLHLYQFQNDPNCKWFVGTAATGGKGIDGLQNVCNYEIYYSNSYDQEDRAQSEDRLHRNGQKNNVTIIDLEVPNTVDTKIVESLKRKEDLAYQVLDHFRELIA